MSRERARQDAAAVQTRHWNESYTWYQTSNAIALKDVGSVLIVDRVRQKSCRTFNFIGILYDIIFLFLKKYTLYEDNNNVYSETLAQFLNIKRLKCVKI